MSRLSPLVATPLRLAGAIAILVCVAALAWYLGSPLFLRTSADEAFPTTRPRPSVPAPTGFGDVAVIPQPPPPETVAQGALGRVDALHNGTGAVLLIRTAEGFVLRFDDVAITNAPDVHVYLSRDTGGKWSEATSLYIGALKATNGSFNYMLPPDAEPSAYRSVVVWCRQFSVLVTWADLH